MGLQFDVRVDLRRMRPVQQALSPQEQERRSVGALNEALGYLQGEVQQHIPVDTGLSRGSVFAQVLGVRPDGFQGRVFSAAPQMPAIEEGRAAGARMPPAGPVEAWMGRHGISLRLSYVIRRAIGRRGLPAHHMFRDAALRGGPTVLGIFARWFRL